MKRNLLWFLCVFALLTSRVAGQTGTTSLHGSVTDKSGGVIQGAKVTLSNPVRAIERTATTSASGAFEFPSLSPGTYSLIVEMTGFRSYQQRSVQLLVDTPASVNVMLEVGSATETIEVTAQAETLNTSNASLGIAFTENQVKQLPLEGRNVPDLLTLQAGVTVTGNRPFLETRPDVDTRNGAVNGAHSDQSNITLDGVDVNDETRGYAFTSVLPVTLDSVQEFRVTTTNYTADQGRSSGAQVSLITKSGTNDFHGSLYEYLRNTITSANDYFEKISEAQNGEPNVPLKLIRNIFGASVGGPIRKDRLFFFANYEGARQREENSVLRIVPSLALRDGVVQYLCQDPTVCPGGTVQGLTGPHQIKPGYQGLSPQDVTTLDPLHLGPNTPVLNYFNTFPTTGFDTSQSDGVNLVGFRFRGPAPTTKNWYIARLDYKLTSSGSHSIFWRGALRNDLHTEPPYLPGQDPQRTLEDYSKGFSVGYTAVLRSDLVNNFRWGYTRQSFGSFGNSDKPFIQFRGLNDDTTSNNSSLQIARTNIFQVPVHNFVDDVSWIKGKHTLQFGVNVEFLRTSRTNTLNSFSTGIANPNFLPTAAIATTGIAGDPGATGNGYSFPAVDSNFGTGYDYPFMALLGSISQVNANYNYTINGTLLPQGTPSVRHFGADSYEFYAQDSWKIKPSLTVTYGLRYSLSSPPWETNGVQVAPTMNLGDWFNLRAQNMNQGIGSSNDPVISLDLAGPAHGKAGFYNWDYHNFGPRIGVAWAPSASGGFWKKLLGGAGQSTVRAGFGVVYDRVGQGVLSTFDKRGSFGLLSQLTNSNGGEDLTTAPRLTTDVNTIPTVDNVGNPIFTPAPAGGFPQTPPFGSQNGAFAAANSVDRSLKTPYSYALDLSVGRELGHDFSIEVSYVGRLSHRLLALEDLAQPADLVDPKSKVDYYSAVLALAHLYEPGGDPSKGVPADQITPAMVGPTAQYWYDMTQPLQPGGAYSLDAGTASFCAPSFNPTDALQANYALFSCFAHNESTAIQVIDQSGFPDANPANAGVVYHGNCGATASIPNCYLNSQYVSLLAWRSVATASYHALQVNIRKRLSKGVQFDVNYTYSKSIDLQSDAERVDLAGSGALGFIQNAWRPKQARGVSDFDTPHQINANWIVELPFGKGRLIGKNAGRSLDAAIGGWQLSGLARWTSGFPVNIYNGSAWPTNWEFNPYATQVGPVVTKTTKNPDGSVNIFPAPQGPTGLGAFSATFPGESGTRNPIRGDGFAGLDASLSKRWIMPWKDSQSLQFRWEVFNVLNLTRFDVQTITNPIDVGGFGNYSGLSTQPRVMQFALRFEF